jgi:hypothetical protein
MNSYFNIEPITINVTPFQTATANAIKWRVASLERNAQSARCMCTLFNSANSIKPLYNWSITIPFSVLSQWLDDSVIDDFIVENSNGQFVKLEEA